MNTQEPIGDPPNVEGPKLAPGKINGAEFKKNVFTPQQIAEIIGDARNAVFGKSASPPSGSLLA